MSTFVPSSPLLAALGLLAAGCITEAAVVERSADAVSADLARALQRIDELEGRLDSTTRELAALRAQVGETDETATLEDRVRGLTQAGLGGRMDALEAWRESTADPAIASLESRAQAVEEATEGHGGRLDALESGVGDQAGRVDALEGWSTTVDSSVAGIASRVDALEGWRTGTADPDLSALADRANQLEGALEFSVLAYSVGSCPEGWEPYEPSFGRFLRGLAPVDSDLYDGREVGSTQEDALQGHRHAVEKSGVPDAHDGTPSSGTANRAWQNTYINMPQRLILGVQTDPAFGTARVANETRPKNVGVLFCTPIEG